MSDRKLKIAYVVPYFYPLRGGTENNALNMALQAAQAGHDVTVFTSDRKRDRVLERTEEEYQGLKIKRLHRILFSQYYLSFLPQLAWQLRQGKFDVIHTHIPGILWQDLSVFFAKLANKKLITINTPHDPFMSRNNYSRVESVIRVIYNPILKFYYSKVYSFAIAVNPNQNWITDLYKMPKERILLVLNGINAEMLEEVEIDPQLKKNYGISDQLMISMVARYHEYKGYQNILQALNKLKDKKLSIKFIGVGDDSGMLSRLQNYVKDFGLEEYVELIESPNDSVRDQILSLSEVFILASRSEAFGIAILEAMAKGNAIITTTTEGGLYLVGDENGLLYDFADIDKLAEHIETLATNPELRQKMIVANLTKAKQFLWHELTKPYLKLLADQS